MPSPELIDIPKFLDEVCAAVLGRTPSAAVAEVFALGMISERARLRGQTVDVEEIRSGAVRAGGLVHARNAASRHS